MTKPVEPATENDLGVDSEREFAHRLMSSRLAGLVESAQQAERDARAAIWEDAGQIERRIDRVVSSFPDEQPVAATDDVVQAFRTAERAVDDVHRAVLSAELARRRSQPPDHGSPDAAHRGSAGTVRTSVARRSSALAAAVGDEIAYLLRRKPRKVLRALLIGVLAGAGYLVWIRIASWGSYQKWTPYLAVLLVSSVMGTAACFNSVSFDARRVRKALDQGAHLWQLLVVKNIALMLLVLPLGIAVSVVLSILAGRPAALMAAIGLVFCLLLLWSGVGNILSVVLPIRDVPVKRHRQDGTFGQFAIEFIVTWFISYLVQFMLIWRIFAAQGVGERYGSTTIAVISMVGGALLTWTILTTVAVSFSHQPAVHRRLRRELDRELLTLHGSVANEVPAGADGASGPDPQGGRNS